MLGSVDGGRLDRRHGDGRRFRRLRLGRCGPRSPGLGRRRVGTRVAEVGRVGLPAGLDFLRARQRSRARPSGSARPAPPGGGARTPSAGRRQLAAALARQCLRLVEPEADDATHGVVADGHPVEGVGGLDRAPVVGDDDELRLVGEAAQRVGEPPDVRLVERRVDLVEDAERDRAGPRASRRAAPRRSARARRPTASRAPAPSCPAAGPRSPRRSHPRSDGSVSDRRANPPPKSCSKRASNATSRARNVVWNWSEIIVSSSTISSRVRVIAVRRSAPCVSSVSSRLRSSAYSSTAKGFVAPSSWNRRRSWPSRIALGGASAGAAAPTAAARSSAPSSSLSSSCSRARRRLGLLGRARRPSRRTPWP